MTTLELIVTFVGSNTAALLLTRLWSRSEHKHTERRLGEIHVLVNGRLSEALKRIKHLESELEKSELEKSELEKQEIDRKADTDRDHD